VSALWPFGVLSLGYVTTNYTIAGLYVSLRGRALLLQYLHALPRIAAIEAIPLLLLPLIALTYLRLGVI